MKSILKKIIITGSNKGIGLGIVQNLARKNKWHIIMACRNLDLAQKSKEQLLKKYPQIVSPIDIQQLDVSNNQSIKNFTKSIKRKFQTIDILFNNAGMAVKQGIVNQNVVDKVFSTNFYGTNILTDQIIPYLNYQGKIINMTSSAGRLRMLSKRQLIDRYGKSNLTKEELYHLLQQYRQSVKNSTHQQQGYPKDPYFVSKIGLNLYTRILAERSDIKQKKIQVYGVCPGYVSTQLTNFKGSSTVEEGVVTPIYLIQLPFEWNAQNQGKFFVKNKVMKI